MRSTGEDSELVTLIAIALDACLAPVGYTPPPAPTTYALAGGEPVGVVAIVIGPPVPSPMVSVGRVGVVAEPVVTIVVSPTAVALVGDVPGDKGKGVVNSGGGSPGPICCPFAPLAAAKASAAISRMIGRARDSHCVGVGLALVHLGKDSTFSLTARAVTAGHACHLYRPERMVAPPGTNLGALDARSNFPTQCGSNRCKLRTIAAGS